MEVRLTPDQEAFVRQAIESGRLHRPEEAVAEALSLWEERERTRAEILAAVDAEGAFSGPSKICEIWPTKLNSEDKHGSPLSGAVPDGTGS
jgi:putative addiction module CopG family antidote